MVTKYSQVPVDEVLRVCIVEVEAEFHEHLPLHDLKQIATEYFAR